MENKYNIKGGIGAYKDNGTRAFVQTYVHDEVSIIYVDNKGVSHTEFIRLRLGTNEGQQIIMLENGKFYMVKGFANYVQWSDELSANYVFNAIKDIAKLNDAIGNLLELYTNEKKNLVKAINEVVVTSGTPRKLQGYIKYLSDGVNPKDAIDLEVRYNDTTKRFEYYSDVGEWILLPQGWQKLANLVRAREYLPSEVLEGTVYGILEESIAVEYKNGVWTECSISVDKIGDEYLVQSVYNSMFNGDATASVIYTPMGWTYLVHYNY